MKSGVLSSLCILLPLLAPLAIAVPAPVIQDRDDVEKRGYLGLWNGGPSVNDIRQVKVLNCWWAASSLAVLMASQEWVENMIRYSDGRPLLGEDAPQDGKANVTLFSPSTGQKFTHISDETLRSQTEDNPNGNWWHDAFSQAALAMGTQESVQGVLPSGEWDSHDGSALTGLKLWTGYEASQKYLVHYSIDDFFNDVGKAATGTPVIINTVREEDMGKTEPIQLGYSHDYAIYNATTDAEGNRIIWARNSWGSTDPWKVEDFFYNSFQVIFLQDFRVLSWPGHGESVEEEAAPASSSATDSAAAGNATATDVNAVDDSTASASASTSSDPNATSSSLTTGQESSAADASSSSPISEAGAVQTSQATIPVQTASAATAVSAAPTAAATSTGNGNGNQYGSPTSWYIPTVSSWTLPYSLIVSDIPCVPISKAQHP
ncbi:hypothetical protein I316_07085 [Kwoniella heveanensis BCC8398]|uniref:Calpain catalytic domain-containing protein n=1 Tax=Kwoniella heveanensis BCC8398 TaxID=1296120 RepID=A0A1B9GJT2_9TREE|nr:hypothetical protein I316_07085 [Kwoniella heveanensis BCC8398]